MELCKDGFLYKIAYGLRKDRPDRSNLCRFFWRVILSAIFIWPPYGLFRAIDYGLIRFLLGAPIAFLCCGYRPLLQRKWPIECGEVKFPFRPIGWWLKIDGEHLMPILVLFVLAVFAFCVVGVGWVLYQAGVFVRHNPWAIIPSVFALALIVLLLSKGVVKRKARDVVGLFADYIKAKKDKVCPIIQFIDPRKPKVS